MPKLTFITSIDLPDDVWENAEVVSRAKPVQGEIEALLLSHDLTGTVEASFDGRKAPRSKVEAMVGDGAHAAMVSAIVKDAKEMEPSTGLTAAEGAHHAKAQRAAE
jgi:hypothetical protein